MTKKVKILISLFFIIILAQGVNAQCREYIQAVAAYQLEPYTMDGNFLSPEIYEGEKVELSRTFLKGQKYKIMVIGMDLFEKKITITDSDGFIIFKNYTLKNNEETQYFTDFEGNNIISLGSNYFEFAPQTSQNLTIKVELEQKAKRKKKRLKGCMGIVVGFATEE